MGDTYRTLSASDKALKKKKKHLTGSNFMTNLKNVPSDIWNSIVGNEKDKRIKAQMKRKK